MDDRAMVDFARRMIQTPSPSGEEMQVARLVAGEMNRLGYESVKIDEKNNVIGWINPAGRPRVMLNGHIDCAATGEMEDPFSGALVDGASYGVEGRVLAGRGACDMKAAVAAMVYAGAAFHRRCPAPRGGVVVTAVALEEMGEGEGTRHVLDGGVTADLAVCGEATGLRVHVGHRGKFNIRVTVRGETSHACDPERGLNAVWGMHAFLDHLRESYSLPSHPVLGPCTLAPVDIHAAPGWESPTIPDVCTAVFDRRILPGETEEKVLGEMEDIAVEVRRRDPRFGVELEIVTRTSPMLEDPGGEPVVTLGRGAEKVMGRTVEVGAWRFGTDAPYIIESGIPCVGFGPGDERYAHTDSDHVAVDEVLTAARVYAQLLEDVCS